MSRPFRHRLLTEEEERRILELLKLWQRGELTLSQIRERTGRSPYLLKKIMEKYGI